MDPCEEVGVVARGVEEGAEHAGNEEEEDGEERGEEVEEHGSGGIVGDLGGVGYAWVMDKLSSVCSVVMVSAEQELSLAGIVMLLVGAVVYLVQRLRKSDCCGLHLRFGRDLESPSPTAPHSDVAGAPSSSVPATPISLRIDTLDSNDGVTSNIRGIITNLADTRVEAGTHIESHPDIERDSSMASDT